MTENSKPAEGSGGHELGRDEALCVSTSDDTTSLDNCQALRPAEVAQLLEWAQKLDPTAVALLRAAMERNFLEDPTEPTLNGWHVFTLADAYKPREPLRYIVSGLFPLPSLSIVYGAPGTFKSLLLAEMAACVAAGVPWLPPLQGKDDPAPIPTLQAPVLWCDFDNGRRRTDERMEAIGKARELPESTPLHYVSMPDPWLDLSDPLVVSDMVRRIVALGAKLVIIDNLGTVSGKADENSAEMVKVLLACRRVAEETGAAVILTHHQRKATGVNARAGETLRGHSSIEAALDLALLVEREEHADTVQLKSTKTRGADVLPFGALFTYKHKERTNELAEVRFFGLPVEDLVSDAAIERAILEVLDGEPVNKGNLAKQVKGHLPDVGINRIRNKIDHLAATGKIVLSSGENNAKLYSLPTKRE